MISNQESALGPKLDPPSNTINTMATRGPSLFIFGSQTPFPSAEKLDSLLSTLLNEPDLHGFAAAVAELQGTWHDLVFHDPDLQIVLGEALLSSFSTWIDEGVFKLEGQSDAEKIPSLVKTPLTVILHLVEYFSFMKKADLSHEQYVESNDKLFEGFCTGMLAAAALSTAADTKKSIVMASAALRLAVAIGAYVDLDEGLFADPPRETSCVAARWKESTQREEVEAMVETIPEVSTIFPNDISVK